MNICTNIKQKFNEAKLRGQKTLKLHIKQTTEKQLEELRECGYNITRIKDKIIIYE